MVPRGVGDERRDLRGKLKLRNSNRLDIMRQRGWSLISTEESIYLLTGPQKTALIMVLGGLQFLNFNRSAYGPHFVVFVLRLAPQQPRCDDTCWKNS